MYSSVCLGVAVTSQYPVAVSQALDFRQLVRFIFVLFSAVQNLKCRRVSGENVNYVDSHGMLEFMIANFCHEIP